jgi:hypothetical protein
MILYKLQCKKGHEFEAWFASSDAFDRQKKKGQLACPSCGTKSVSKALMTPNVTPRSRRKAAAPDKQQPTGSRKPETQRPETQRPEAQRPDTQRPEAQRPEAQRPETQRVAAHSELVTALRKLRAEIEGKSEYVGARFPEEARKIHYEEVPARGIHGEATAEEAKALKDEGIEFYPLPILPEDQN